MMSETDTKDKRAESSTAPVPTDPNATRTNEENPVETHELQEAVNGDTESKVETETVDKNFIFVHNLDPARQIPGTNKYLDVEQRMQAELERAAVEDREPDLVNPPATQGTPYRSAEQIKSELPPHADIKADVTLPVVVTKEEKQASEDAEARAKSLQNGLAYSNPAVAQERQAELDKSEKDK